MCSFFSDVVFVTEYIDLVEHGEKAGTSVVSKPGAMKDDKPNEFVDTMSIDFDAKRYQGGQPK